MATGPLFINIMSRLSAEVCGVELYLSFFSIRFTQKVCFLRIWDSELGVKRHTGRSANFKSPPTVRSKLESSRLYLQDSESRLDDHNINIIEKSGLKLLGQLCENSICTIDNFKGLHVLRLEVGAQGRIVSLNNANVDDEKGRRLPSLHKPIDKYAELRYAGSRRNGILESMSEQVRKLAVGSEFIGARQQNEPINICQEVQY
ncbi:hypothetical protein BYT27DRAFT_7215459 [Phlegmacium glaucopus]|nr:hypothetical protein BYT27DRAFT_7215459 [Phlegmacium glaucopus]